MCLGVTLLLVRSLAQPLYHKREKCRELTRYAHSCLVNTPATGLPVYIKDKFEGTTFNSKVLDCYYENADWASAQHMCEGVMSLQLIMTCMKNTMFEIPIPLPYYKSDVIDFADKVTECLATLLHHPMPYGRSAAEVTDEPESEFSLIR
ncbi:uncharacterized protein LOC119465020 [Dermacentor silvarum]|uniref:uncharacterized protein LOC119465020 n=1 Tax=Dermacentor silvarum TaxID=543639 RepID=UPI002100C5B9|nr:uncharacterized protein LOC119465020 [Dermacentor silvarum]